MAETYSLSCVPASKNSGDVLVLPITDISTLRAALPAGTAEGILKETKKRKFTAGWGQHMVMPAPPQLDYQYVALVGAGAEGDTVHQNEGMRRGLAVVTREATRQRVKSLHLMCDPEQIVPAVEAVSLTNYNFDVHRTKHNGEHHIAKVVLLVTEENKARARRALQTAMAIASGVKTARDLVNQPANFIAPSELVAQAKQIANLSSHISVRILDRKQALKEGFSGFLAVAQGASSEPYVIHLTYTPPKKPKGSVALIGKGITFDSGGLSLKPADMMEDMKTDMAGAATVLGVFDVLANQGAEVQVHGIIASCENMPSGAAYRPGDVIAAMDGTTIEVLNTDAEGRITLADALIYARQHQPDYIVDIATLTGACVVALGENVAGMWSTDSVLVEHLEAAAETAGENIVNLPMPPEYEEHLKSKVADIKNIPSTRYGGAITAAQFLKRFAGDSRWAHIDIAGPSFVKMMQVPYWEYGGTGFGVRTLWQLVQRLAAKN